MMFDIGWMGKIVALGTIGIGVTVVTYLVLRLFVWSKAESKSLEYIRRHALWTGLIAWAFSSLTGANRAGIYDPNQYYPDHWSTIPWLAIIAPPVAVVAVHAIGQSTWPAPKSPKRSAVLEFRSIRDYIEPALGWTVAGIFVLTAVVLGFLFFAPEFTGPNSVILGEYGQSIQTRFGRVPGYVLATALSMAFAVLVLGTVVVMRLIASRRSLEALTPEQNKTLRVIGMNRLLRVSATVASGLAAVAGNYLMQPDPDSTATSWVNWLAIVNMVVLIAMLVWKPPTLDPAKDDAESPLSQFSAPSSALTVGNGLAVMKFSNSASAATLPLAIVGAAAGYAMHEWFGLIGIVTVAAVFILLSYLALELVLKRNYGAPGSPRSKLRAALPWPLYAAFAIAAAGLAGALINAHGVATSNGPNTWDGWDAPEAMYLVPGIAALVILVVGIGAVCFVLTRPSLDNTSASLDRMLRRRSLFRIARTVTGSYYAILGILLIMVPVAPHPNPLMPRFESGIFGILCIVISLLMVLYPLRALTPAGFTPKPLHLHK